MSSAPKYKRDDYVALCRSKTIPDHYMLFLNCVFQINDCIKDEDSYNYVLSIVEGASDKNKQNESGNTGVLFVFIEENTNRT